MSITVFCLSRTLENYLYVLFEGDNPYDLNNVF